MNQKAVGKNYSYEFRARGNAKSHRDLILKDVCNMSKCLCSSGKPTGSYRTKFVGENFHKESELLVVSLVEKVSCF